jgi:hypothetical protein
VDYGSQQYLLVSATCILIFQNGHYIFLTLQIPCQNKYHVARRFAHSLASSDLPVCAAAAYLTPL